MSTSTTQVAWALMRKWAAHYGVQAKALKNDHFQWAMKLANSYAKNPKTITRQVGPWLKK